MIVFYTIAILVFIYILSTCCGVANSGLQKLRGWAYAHRGLHGEGVPENSMEAFRRAKNAGYGMELDIHLLADGKLAVLHDAALARMTGSEGRIEDLRSEELGSFFLNGTQETIPLFQDVLDLVNGEVALIVELKAQLDNYEQLCAKACELLDRYNGVYCIESFDPRCAYWFRKHRPDVIRGQLTENYFLTENCKVPLILRIPLVLQMFNFLTRPDFVAYRYRDRKHFSNFLVQKLWGAASVTWTLTSQEEYDTAVAENRIPIFEGFLP